MVNIVLTEHIYFTFFAVTHVKWNVTPLNSWGSNFFFAASASNLIPCSQALGMGNCDKGINLLLVGKHGLFKII